MEELPSLLAPPAPRKLFVGNIPPAVTAADFAAAFTPFGEIDAVRLPPPPPPPHRPVTIATVSRRHGFVTFAAAADAADARANMHDATLCGGRLRVTWARGRVRAAASAMDGGGEVGEGAEEEDEAEGEGGGRVGTVGTVPMRGTGWGGGTPLGEGRGKRTPGGSWRST